MKRAKGESVTVEKIVITIQVWRNLISNHGYSTRIIDPISSICDLATRYSTSFQNGILWFSVWHV